MMVDRVRCCWLLVFVMIVFMLWKFGFGVVCIIRWFW